MRQGLHEALILDLGAPPQDLMCLIQEAKLTENLLLDILADSLTSASAGINVGQWDRF